MPTYEYVCEKCGHEFEAVRNPCPPNRCGPVPKNFAPEKMGARPGEKENQRRRRIAFQRQRLLHHRLPQRKIQGRGQKRFRRARSLPKVKTNRRNRPPPPAKAGAKRKKMKPPLKTLRILTRRVWRFQRFDVPPRCLRAFFAPSPARAIFAGRKSRHAQQRLRPVRRHRRNRVSRLPRLPAAATNADLVRLEPALLAVSAERIKESLWRELGISPVAVARENFSRAASGAVVGRKCHHHFHALSATAGISRRTAGRLSRTRFVRALTGVLLLEFANRERERAFAEIPAWLTDGFVAATACPTARRK
jgi:hypothetical protein